jgi:hypothetical protein
MCLETHVADVTKTTTMQLLLEQCLNYIYQQNWINFTHKIERRNKSFEFSHQTV